MSGKIVLFLGILLLFQSTPFLNQFLANYRVGIVLFLGSGDGSIQYKQLRYLPLIKNLLNNTDFPPTYSVQIVHAEF